jgi:hypothetical protein
MNNAISVDEIISAAKMQLRLQNTTEHDDWFELLVYEAIRRIDSLSCFVKRTCTIDIMDHKGVLPKGFQRLLGLRFLCDDLNENQGHSLSSFFDPFIYVDSKFLMDCECDLNNPLIRHYSTFVNIQGEFLYVNTQFDITGVRMAFLGLNVDENGLPVVYDYYQPCLTDYICWKFTRAYSSEYREADIRSYEAGYYAQRAWVKATDVKEDFIKNKRKIGELMNGLLVSRFENELGNPGY